MSPAIIAMIIIIAALVVVIIVLTILGKRAQRKRDEQQVEIDKVAQTYSMLIIDKKKMKLRDAGFPQFVLDQVPKRMLGRKIPIVKAKIGPKISSFICEPDIFDMVPVKKEIKGTVSGLYLTGVKGLRGALETPEKKQGFIDRLFNGRK
ncbi:hypothetical protein [Eubacterium oxidoreducens]|uniref:Uncharacterized protein n=1 Tax=Eubacterium oxidoreducens TaxID=1732 RepID=A0A1G6BAY6_EUBOX|nr:hypothetical protein [Eubacterium oxidoreducens]SDB17822.1 hypothetical protein SAMN02910417_01308 [Eubacterium oxidoreducens]